MRTVFHIDMDAFYASIEIVRNPSLRGKPVVVGGSPEHRGVVSTCSYEARAFGIHSAMPLSQAKRLCPDAIFLDVDMSLYRRYSDAIMAIFYAHTHMVEVVSVDEAYVDVSAIMHLYGGAERLAQLMRREVKEKTQLNCSIGVASNKLLAKIASSMAKPNGLKVIAHGIESQFLAPLPIQMIPGIGEKTRLALNRAGFVHISDLQAAGMEALTHRYGVHGYHYYLAANGLDNRPVATETGPPKSISAAHTYDNDENNAQVILKTLDALIVRIYQRLCAHKMRAGGVTLKLRYTDFKTITRSHMLLSHTNQLEGLRAELLYLFNKTYEEGVFVRLIGVSLEKLADTYWQPNLWDSNFQKEYKRS